MNEITKQFDKIFEEHHSPKDKEKKRLAKNRKRRFENTKKELL